MIQIYFSELSCFTISPDISVCPFDASQGALSSVKGFLRFENNIETLPSRKIWMMNSSFCIGVAYVSSPANKKPGFLSMQKWTWHQNRICLKGSRALKKTTIQTQTIIYTPEV